jgi:glycosyltransferase involved in cell wall biosynthesis
MVSIGLPVYNGERYLESALESMLSQTYTDLELIISDNASDDRTRDICLDYARKDTRIRYGRNERNLGAAANYNRVVARSRGQYFKWVAHDDVYSSHFLAQCLEALESNPRAVLCYSPAIFIDEDGAEIGRETELLDYSDARPSRRFHTWVMEKREGWCHPITGVIRADVLRRTPLIGPFVSSDVTLVAELALWGEIHRTPEFLFYRRDHPGRSTAGHRSMEEMTEWFDTSVGKGRAYMPRWRLGVEYSRAVARTPTPVLEKMACAAIMARWFTRQRRGLRDELMRWAEGPRRQRS